MPKKEGTDWFERHLGTQPLLTQLWIDGCDPAAFVWLILEMETRLAAETEHEQDNATYPRQPALWHCRSR